MQVKIYNLAIQIKIESINAGDKTISSAIVNYCFDLLFAIKRM
jgi:hypothetical protein